MFPAANVRAPAATASARGTRSRPSVQPKTFRGRTRPNLPLSSKYKTELCHYLAEQGRCPFGDQCTYAHSRSEVRYIERHPKHKTLPCRDFSTVGFCPFGERCSFIHYKRNPEDILRGAYELLQQQAATSDTSFRSAESWRSPSVTITDAPGHNPEEIPANHDSHSARSSIWPSSWSDVEIHCPQAPPLCGAESNTQGFLQVPGATSRSWGTSMSSSPHSSSGFPTTPSLSPLGSRSRHSVGSMSRASSSSDLSDNGAAVWPAQLHFAPENVASGLWNSCSDVSYDIADARIASDQSDRSAYGQRLPVFRDISLKDEESCFNLHGSLINFN